MQVALREAGRNKTTPPNHRAHPKQPDSNLKDLSSSRRNTFFPCRNLLMHTLHPGGHRA
jgi:hypothetical protein